MNDEVFSVGQKVRVIRSAVANHQAGSSYIGQEVEIVKIVDSGSDSYAECYLSNDKNSTRGIYLDELEPVLVEAPEKPIKLPKKAIQQHEIIGQDHNIELIKLGITKDYPMLLIGETGTGKTSLIRQQAIEQKADWVRFNLTGETTVDEFVGKYELEGGQTIWRDGILLQAMKKGQWLIVDEINVALPEILFVLHSLLDDDKFVVVASHAGEVVRPDKKFRFFATMNPVDEYAGTKELNKAFQSRFNMVLQVAYPSKRIEARIVSDKASIANGIATMMADVAVALRKAKKKDEIFYTCSTRDLIQWGKLVEAGLDEGTAFIVAILNKANGDKPEILKIYEQVVKRHLAIEAEIGEAPSYEFFETEWKKLNKDKIQWEADKDKRRNQISAEIIEELSQREKAKSEEKKKASTAKAVAAAKKAATEDVFA